MSDKTREDYEKWKRERRKVDDSVISPREIWQAAKEKYGASTDDDFHSDERDAKRYRYIKQNMEWRRSGELLEDGHAFVGCRFPYLANFSSSVMLDHNIDKMLEAESGDKQ